jgi:pyruvate formate lyase activating enzyme
MARSDCRFTEEWAMLFNIQRWSLHDGPGIRTTVFFKGCPLRCRWCSNPESWSFEKQLLVDTERCAACGACIAACPAGANRTSGSAVVFDRGRCAACGRCVDGCPQMARELVGSDWTADRIIRMLERDAVFYRASGGGVTFSGGEPFARMDLLLRLARACSLAGIATAVETSGFFSLADAAETLEWIGEIFIDLKHTDDVLHRQLTGVSNRRIIETILGLDKMGRALTIRVPLIQGLTSTAANVAGVIDLCRRLKHLKGVELLPYHDLGAGKYARLGLPFNADMAAPRPEATARIVARLRAQGIAASCSSIPVR